MREGDLPDGFHAVRLLGCGGPQEGTASGRVEEQIACFDGGARRTACGSRLGEIVARGPDRPGGLGVGGASGDLQPADRCDGRERFAAEAQSGDSREILGLFDLAGGMLSDGEQQLVGLDAVAIVGHTDEISPTGIKLNTDACGTGIERVLDQFFDDRGGSLNDFTGGDLVGDQCGEPANGPSNRLRCYASGCGAHRVMVRRLYTGAMNTPHDVSNTVFSKIIRGEIPAQKLYEDAHVIAILDLNPLAPGHTLVIPKEPAATMGELSDEFAGALGRVLPRICRAVCSVVGAEQCNILQNNGTDAGQSVFHVHIHVIPRFPDRSEQAGLELIWNAGQVDPEAQADLGRKIARKL